MASIDVRRTYADGDILLAADFDAFLDDLETFLNTTKINDDNIQNNGITASDKLIDASISTAKIANLAVTTAKINDLSVTSGKLASGAVISGKIDSLAVGETNIAAGAVTETKIAGGSVTAAKLGNNAVTTDKINAGAVTFTKLAGRAAGTAIGEVSLSSSSGANSNGSSAVTDIVSCSITTNGRPVFVGLVPDGTGNQSYLQAGSGGAVEHRLLRGVTLIHYSYQAAGNSVPPGTVWTIDFPSAGTYTYKYQNQNFTANALAYYVKLLVYEL